MSAEPETDTPPRETEVLLTAEEAFPTLERAFLAARREILLGFRIFDPDARLLSPEARRIGDDWSDLIAHTLGRGVAIRLVLSDFDPVGAPELHRTTWRSLHRFEEIRRSAGPDARLDVRASLHPAEVGLLFRIAFYPVIQRKLAAAAADLNRQEPHDRERALAEMPGLAARLETRPDGTLRPRRWRLPRMNPVTHHQKVAVFDREVLYIGGLDLNDRRYDTKEHDRAAESTWHDLQVCIRGALAETAARHLESFLDVVEGTAPPPPSGPLLLTLSAARRRLGWARIGPRTVDRSISAAYLRLAAESRSLIYMETQFFRDPGLARRLAETAGLHPELDLILVMPAAPEQLAFSPGARLADRYGEWLQTRCVRRLAKAFGPRFIALSPAQSRSADGDGRDTLHGAPLVYVHAKVACFDAEAAIVSSANLNGRSLRWDTEAGVLLDRPADVRRLRERLIRHWLGSDPDPAFLETSGAVAAWRQRALSNARSRPEDRRGFLLPYDLEAAEQASRAVPGMPEEMV